MIPTFIISLHCLLIGPDHIFWTPWTKSYFNNKHIYFTAFNIAQICFFFENLHLVARMSRRIPELLLFVAFSAKKCCNATNWGKLYACPVKHSFFPHLYIPQYVVHMQLTSVLGRPIPSTLRFNTSSGSTTIAQLRLVIHCVQPTSSYTSSFHNSITLHTTYHHSYCDCNRILLDENPNKMHI